MAKEIESRDSNIHPKVRPVGLSLHSYPGTHGLLAQLTDEQGLCSPLSQRELELGFELMVLFPFQG